MKNNYRKYVWVDDGQNKGMRIKFLLKEFLREQEILR